MNSPTNTRSSFLAENELISLSQLCAMIGRTSVSIRRWERGAEPRFPKARFIAKRKYWLRTEIEAFLQNLPRQYCLDQATNFDEGGR